MKKILSLLLCCVLMISVIGCTAKKDSVESAQSDTNVAETPAKADPETKKFNKLADDITTKIEKEADLSELKKSVENIKEEVQTKVSEAAQEHKEDYDIQQIAVFMMEQAVNDYEAAKSSGDEEKIKQAKDAIEMAKKMWSSKVK